MASSGHAAVVSEWMERVVADRPSRDVVQIFGRGLLAIWDRAHLTLGEVSLRAIVQRVLHVGHARFPVLRALRLDRVPESFRQLFEQEGVTENRAELIAAVHFVLTELLALLGTLTAEILTAALHEALRSVEAPAPAPAQPMGSKSRGPSHD